MPAFSDYPRVQHLLTLHASPNRTLIARYDAFLKAQGRAERYRSVSIRILLQLDAHLQGRPFATETRAGIHFQLGESAIVGFLNTPTKQGQPRKGQGRMTYAVRIKSFLKWLNGNDEFPACVKRLKTTVPKKEVLRIRKGDLWTPEDMKGLLECCAHPRDKAMLATIYDLGAAPEEVLGLHVGDVLFADRYAEVTINVSKGRNRQLVAALALPYLRAWLEVHPLRHDRQAPLWLTKRGLGLGPLAYGGLNEVMQKAAAKLKAIRPDFQKPANLYILRHSRLTELAAVLREQQLKVFGGWTPSSRMPERYIHLDGSDLRQPLLEAQGIIAPAPTEMNDALRPKLCPRCQFAENPADAIYCRQCEYPLTPTAIEQRERLRRDELADVKQQLAAMQQTLKLVVDRQAKVRVRGGDVFP